MNRINDYIKQYLVPNLSLGTHAPEKTDPLGFDFRLLLMQQMQTVMGLNQTFQQNNTETSFVRGNDVPLPARFENLVPSPSTMPIEQAIGKYNQIAETQNLKKQPPTNEFNGLIQRAARKYDVDENVIHAIIKMESDYNPDTKSHAGAVGLMQLMPVTAREVGVTNRDDNAQNIDGGTHYFSKMLKKHNGDLRLALASYNAGPGNVRKYGGIPPFKETQNYVRKVMDYYLH
jgi:soluble lytic murein transglycosylase-like protein